MEPSGRRKAHDLAIAPAISGDPVQLQRVLLNLVMNAMDRSSANVVNSPVSLRFVETRAGHIVVRRHR